jgi:hypothetical protein
MDNVTPVFTRCVTIPSQGQVPVSYRMGSVAFHAIPVAPTQFHIIRKRWTMWLLFSPGVSQYHHRDKCQYRTEWDQLPFMPSQWHCHNFVIRIYWRTVWLLFLPGRVSTCNQGECHNTITGTSIMVQGISCLSRHINGSVTISYDRIRGPVRFQFSPGTVSTCNQGPPRDSGTISSHEIVRAEKCQYHTADQLPCHHRSSVTQDNWTLLSFYMGLSGCHTTAVATCSVNFLCCLHTRDSDHFFHTIIVCQSHDRDITQSCQSGSHDMTSSQARDTVQVVSYHTATCSDRSHDLIPSSYMFHVWQRGQNHWIIMRLVQLQCSLPDMW